MNDPFVQGFISGADMIIVFEFQLVYGIEQCECFAVPINTNIYFPMLPSPIVKVHSRINSQSYQGNRVKLSCT